MPRRRGHPEEAVRATRVHGFSLTDPAGRTVPGLGDEPLRRRDALNDGSGRGRPEPPLRAAPGARRREALLGVPRRDRQAPAARGGLAGDASRARADHPTLPPVSVGTSTGGAGATPGGGPTGPGRRAGASRPRKPGI